ncbi:MAG: hypothetical protein V3569_02085 [Acholeplasmataceae bacterium]
MNQTKTLRKMAIFVLIIAGILTLSACSNSSKTPYGDLSDDAYVTLDGITITEKELYDQLRLQSASALSSMIDNIVFAENITDVKALLSSGNEDLNTYFDETINSSIHNISDLEDLKEFFETDYDQFYRNVERFADSQYLLDNTLNIQTVIDSIMSLPVPYEGYASLSFLVNNYAIRAAQREYAKELLATQVTDEDDKNYISEQSLVTYYKNNKEGRYDVDALVVRFINLNEANAAMYHQSIKADAKGAWYKIPDIRIAKGEVGYVNLSATSDSTEPVNAYVVSILQDLDLLDKLGENYENRSALSREDFENYYKKYSINTSRDLNRDVALTTSQVKEAFVSIYNLLNPTAQVQISGSTIIGKGDTSYSPTLTYDELTKVNTSLRSHIYTTLVSESSMEDPNDTTDGQPYSSRFTQFGSPYYLVFKLNDGKAAEEGVLVEDPEDAEKEIFSSSASAIREEMYDLLLESKLTSAYISEVVTQLYEEVEIDIFDPIVRILYEQNYGYNGTTDNKSGDIVATVDGTEITVADFYARLEKSYGINIALDVLSNEFLVSSEKYTITEEDRESYQTQFEDIISQFSANNFASAGFPATMGREKFLLLAFGSRTNQEAINQIYVYPELRDQYLKDYEVHYGEDVYEKFSELAKLQYDNYKSMNVSHLLIYVDQNGDGSPDNPQDYLDTLDAIGQQAVLEGLVDLVEILYDKIGYYSSFANGFQTLVTEFNNSGRIMRGNDIPPVGPNDPKLDYQPELTWARFRQLGFYLKFENLSSPITNTSNLISSQQRLDEVFYTRAMSMYNPDATLPLLDLYDSVITQDELSNVKSSFGWHLILNTSVSESGSVMYLQSSDSEGKYISSSDETLNFYNSTTDWVSPNQVKFYLIESNSDEGITLPTSVQTAFNTQFSPVLTRYQGTYMQRELVFKLIEDAAFSGNQSARFNVIREINRRQMNEYMLSADGLYDNNYASLYVNWFNILEG